MSCEQIRTGRTLLVSFNRDIDCETSPLTSTTSADAWKPIGLVQSTNITTTVREVTSNTDSSTITDTAALGLDVEFSVSVNDAPVDSVGVSNQDALRNYIRESLLTVATLKTPKLWLRFKDTAANEYRYYYVMGSSIESSGEVEGLRSGSFSFKMVPTYKDSNPSFQKESYTP